MWGPGVGSALRTNWQLSVRQRKRPAACIRLPIFLHLLYVLREIEEVGAGESERARAREYDHFCRQLVTQLLRVDKKDGYNRIVYKYIK